MFCHNCGKEIADGVNFCPRCGKTQDLSNKIMKNEPSGVVDNALSSAQNIGNQVKAVTEDKAQACVDMAKETAPNFADDVKQVTEDRDTSSFFKKNNQRNTKIVAGLIAIIVVMFVAFWGSSKYEKEAIIEAETQAGLLSDIASVHSSRVIVKAQKDDLMDYLIFVDTTNKLKRKMKLAYMVVVNMKTDKKKAVYLGYVSKDGDKEVVEKYKEYLKSDGFTIK